MRSFWLLTLSLALLALPAESHDQPGRFERPFIDLDEDGTTHFVLRKTAAIGNEEVTTFEAMIDPVGKSKVVAQKQEKPEVGDEERFVAAFEKGDTIGHVLPDTLEWAPKVPLPPMVYKFASDESVPWWGPWPREAPQYLGLKLVKDGNTYYGWAHLPLDRKYEWALSIRDKAYNPRPGRSIRAGHKP